MYMFIYNAVIYQNDVNFFFRPTGYFLLIFECYLFNHIAILLKKKPLDFFDYHFNFLKNRKCSLHLKIHQPQVSLDRSQVQRWDYQFQLQNNPMQSWYVFIDVLDIFVEFISAYWPNGDPPVPKLEGSLIWPPTAWKYPEPPIKLPLPYILLSLSSFPLSSISLVWEKKSARQNTNNVQMTSRFFMFIKVAKTIQDNLKFTRNLIMNIRE